MSQALVEQILQFARITGWARLHIRPAQTEHGWRTPIQGDGKGFPDLVLVRPPRLIVAESKRDGEKPTPEQEWWLDLFERIPGVEVYVWRPKQWDEIQRILQMRPGPAPLRRARPGINTPRGEADANIHPIPAPYGPAASSGR